MKDQNIMRVLKWLPQMQPFSFLKTTNGQIFDVCVAERALLPTSWGGTPNVIVLKSTFWYDSMHGNTKNIPTRG